MSPGAQFECERYRQHSLQWILLCGLDLVVFTEEQATPGCEIPIEGATAPFELPHAYFSKPDNLDSNQVKFGNIFQSFRVQMTLIRGILTRLICVM